MLRATIHEKDKKMDKAIYRFLTKEEFDKWMTGRKDEISSPYVKDGLRQSNNHKYVEGVKYVHFFKHIEDAPIILSILDLSHDHLCKFEIDEDVLLEHRGVGKYTIDFNDCKDVCEYAVPLDLIYEGQLKEFRIVNGINDVRYINNYIGWNTIKDNSMEID